MLGLENPGPSRPALRDGSGARDPSLPSAARICCNAQRPPCNDVLGYGLGLGTNTMRRREFITLLGGAAATWPLTTQAQQPVLPVVGFLRSTSPADSANLIAALRHGMNEVGYVEGQNVLIEYRWAEGQTDRLPALAADLVRRQVAVIIAGGLPATRACKGATATIPIVFSTGSDPVTDGFVASLNRPGGNFTGVVFINSVLGAKRLELLRQLVPKATIIGVLMSPNDSDAEAEQRDVLAAAQAIGQRLIVLEVSSDRDIEAAFATFVQRGVDALFVGTGAFMLSNREQVAALAALHALPACYFLKQFVTAGGLMSYGTSITDAYRQAGIYVGRILKGEKPANLPVIQSTKFEFVINLKTAKKLDLEIPPTLLALADEVIE
jgi:putative ABC transport system substrate-binding protein